MLCLSWITQMNSCINHSWDTCSSYNETVSRRSMYLYLGKTVFKIKYFIYVMLVLAGIELTLSAVASMGLCFGFVLETTLITQGCFSYCWAGLAQHQGQGKKGIFETTGHHVQQQNWGEAGVGPLLRDCQLFPFASLVFIYYLSLLFFFFLELIFPHPVNKLYLYQPRRFLTFTPLILSPHPMGQEAE